MLEVCLDNSQAKGHHEVQWNISDILSCQGNLSIKKNNRFLLSNYPFHLFFSVEFMMTIYWPLWGRSWHLLFILCLSDLRCGLYYHYVQQWFWNFRRCCYKFTGLAFEADAQHFTSQTEDKYNNIQLKRKPTRKLSSFFLLLTGSVAQSWRSSAQTRSFYYLPNLIMRNK